MDETVRPHVRNAWERSRAHGCSPYMPRADLLSAAETIDLLKREARLIEITAPFLGALSRAAGTERHAAMLADAAGRVLKVVGDAQTVADQQFPRAGSLLSEAAAGANGIGTPLADGHYVELVGAEHYIKGFHAFTCQGVPLHVSAGTCAGVLSMSVRRIETAHSVRDILFCASEAAECELLSARLAEMVGAGGAIARVAELLRQDIVQRIATTRLQLEIAARRIAAAGDATAALQGAELLIDKFRRQAALWRNLVDDTTGSPEPIAVADLVTDFVALMATEARVAGVEIVEYRMDQVLAFDDVRALTRRLLTSMLNALHRAAKHSAIRVNTVAAAGQATIGISGMGLRDRPFELSVYAPLLA
jgi:sigma-54 dependent transcriptional regulator, acetoin dehydrogenase operon transcriptional activator AcoR